MRAIAKAVAAAIIGLAAGVAAAAPKPLVSFVTTGTIQLGIDGLGLFGPVNGSLNGLPFAATVTLDTRTIGGRQSTQYENDWRSPWGTMYGSYTVAGHTYTWSSSVANAELLLRRNLSATGTWVDSAEIGGGAIAADGLRIAQDTRLYSGLVPFLASIDPEQMTAFDRYLWLEEMWSFTDFQATGSDGAQTALWSWTPLTHAAWVALPVPEPGQYGMLLAGLAVVGFGLRRRA